MERLVAPVLRPRVHLTRYHGVLGPHYKYRKQIILKPTELKTVQDQEIIETKQRTLKKNMKFIAENPFQFHNFGPNQAKPKYQD